MDMQDSEQTESTDLDVEVTENQFDDPDTPMNDSVTIPKDNTNQRTRVLRLPLARIRNMMKLNPDCSLISQDSIFLLTKATEIFIEFMAREAVKQLSGKRKTLLKRDVDNVVENNPNLCFLDGALE